jgi:succinate dehydrogenase / fumarate reductase membrane anchor subunit
MGAFGSSESDGVSVGDGDKLTEFKTPLSKARGLGTARLGVEHWWMQRVTAVALILLSLWLVFFLDRLLESSYAEMLAWLAKPHNAVLLLAYLLVSAYHAMLGLKVVIEDYVHSEWLKILSLLLVQLGGWLLVLTQAFAALRLWQATV